MAQVVFRLEGDDAGAVRAFLRLTDAERKATLEAKKLASAQKEVKKGTKELGEETNTVTTSIDRAGRSAVQFLAGYASLAGIVRLHGQWAEHLQKIRNLQGQMAGEGLDKQKMVQSLAEQLGLAGAAGLLNAMGQAGEIARAGSVDLATAANILQASRSQIKTDAGSANQIAAMVARSIGKTGGSAEEGVALVELLMNAGVRTPDEARAALAKVQGSLLGSPELGVGKFAQSVVSGGAGLFALGGSLDDILQLSAQGRAVAGGKPLAGAELVKQIAQNVMANEGFQKIVQSQLGLKSVDDVLGVPAIAQIQAVGAAIEGSRAAGGPEAVQRLLSGVEGSMRMQALKFFSPAALETGRAARDTMGGFSAADLEREWSAFAETDVAVNQRLSTAQEVRRAESAHLRFLNTELITRSKALLDEARAAGHVPFYREKLRTDLGLERAAALYIQRSALGLTGDPFTGAGVLFGLDNSELPGLRESGILPDEPIFELEQLNRRQLIGVRQFLRRRRSKHGYEDLTATDIAAQEGAIEHITQLLADPSFEGGLRATIGRGGPVTIINNYYNGDNVNLNGQARDVTAGEMPVGVD